MDIVHLSLNIGNLWPLTCNPFSLLYFKMVATSRHKRALSSTESVSSPRPWRQTEFSWTSTLVTRTAWTSSTQSVNPAHRNSSWRPKVPHTYRWIRTTHLQIMLSGLQKGIIWMGSWRLYGLLMLSLWDLHTMCLLLMVRIRGFAERCII